MPELHHIKSALHESRHPSQKLRDSITRIAISGNGKWAISGTYYNVIKIWNVDTGQAVATFEGKFISTAVKDRLPIYSLQVNEDGSRAISGGKEGVLKLWDLAQGELLHTFENQKDQGSMNQVAVSQDWKRAISGATDGSVTLWDLETGQFLDAQKEHQHPVYDVAMSGDGNWAVSASSISFRSIVYVWALSADRTRLHQHQIMGSGRQRVPNRSQMWLSKEANVGAVPGRHQLWLSQEGERVIFPGTGQMFPKGETGLLVWDVNKNEAQHTLSGHTSSINKIAVDEDHGLILSASSDTMVKVWDFNQGQEQLTFRGHTGLVYDVLMTRAGKRAASVSYDQTMHLWDLATGKTAVAFTSEGPISGLGMSHDGNRMVVAEDTGQVHFLHVRG